MTDATWNGDAASELIAIAGARGLNMSAEYLMGLSKELVPVRDRDLINSANVQQATPDDLEAGVTYDTPYAVTQHETLTFEHPTTENPNAQAKYLEKPLVENEEELLKIQAAQIRRAL